MAAHKLLLALFSSSDNPGIVPTAYVRVGATDQVFIDNLGRLVGDPVFAKRVGGLIQVDLVSEYDDFFKCTMYYLQVTKMEVFGRCSEVGAPYSAFALVFVHTDQVQVAQSLASIPEELFQGMEIEFISLDELRDLDFAPEAGANLGGRAPDASATQVLPIEGGLPLGPSVTTEESTATRTFFAVVERPRKSGIYGDWAVSCQPGY